MHDIVAAAIAGRLVISFSYDGHARVVEPHRLGITSKGEYVLRAFQVGGTTSSGAVEGWRLFSLAKMQSVSVQDDTFTGVRVGYSATDRAMATIVAAL